MPKTALSGTAIAAVISVSRIADSASGSPSEASARRALAQRLGEDRDERREHQNRAEAGAARRCTRHAAGRQPGSSGMTGRRRGARQRRSRSAAGQRPRHRAQAHGDARSPQASAAASQPPADRGLSRRGASRPMTGSRSSAEPGGERQPGAAERAAETAGSARAGDGAGPAQSGPGVASTGSVHACPILLRLQDLDEVDGEQHQERDRQHGDRDGDGAVVVELLEPDDDEQRRDLGLSIGRLPAMKMTEPYSPTPRASASAKPVSSAGVSIGRITLTKVRARPAPRVAETSSTSRSISSITGCTVRTTNGRPMKTSATPDAERRVGDLDAERRQQLAEGAVRGVERGQRDAGDRGRQREGQVDGGVDQPPQREAVAGQHPGERQAEDEVEERGERARCRRTAAAPPRPARC